MIQNNRNITIHLVKKVGYLVVLLFVSTKFFKFLFRNDTGGSIAGDNSDWNIILINFLLLLGYLIFLIFEAVSLFQKKLIAFRNVNISIVFTIIFILIVEIIWG